MRKAFWAMIFFLGSYGQMRADVDAESLSMPPQQDFTQTMVMIGIALLFFYFILWRPEQKRRKTMEDQRSALKKGDKVNAMGILGSVAKVQEQTVILRMYDGSKIEFFKAAISEIFPVSDEEAKRWDKEDL